MKTRQITLKHLLIAGRKYIGLQFYPDKVVQALVKELPSPRWSEQYRMVFIPNTKENVQLIFRRFKGVAWVNGQYFFRTGGAKKGNPFPDMEAYRHRKLSEGYRPCPESYLEKLELKRYAMNTVRTYVGCFEAFINHFKDRELLEINELEIRTYLQQLIREGKSDSTVNQALNSIKFYYEVVEGMPNRFYEIERPHKKERLPEVLSQEQVLSMIRKTRNLKHRYIISLLYSAGLRRGSC
ncbi:phage integrase N-terminal SAM-like domain-containing protein [Limibacter armeniacum]|uniref:tyrosine-type recombinase/integrase n=1 Tax=Limibacter armeniacum TaxID=466084 RepID=UPI002FE55276